MATTIADYIASLRLKPDLQSLKKADRWFQLLDSKVARYSKKISKSGNLLGVGQTVKGITDLQKAEDKRAKASVKNSDLHANAQVKAYNKELAAIQRKARFEHKELKDKETYLKRVAAAQARVNSRIEKSVKYYNPATPKTVKQVSSAAGLMNSHIPAFRQNQALMRQQATEARNAAKQAAAQARQQAVMDRMHGQALYMNRQFDARRNAVSRPIAAQTAGSYRNLTTLGGAGIAGFGLNQLNKAIRELEMLPISLEAVTGSATRAAAELSYLNSVGNDLGLTTRAIAPSYTKFLASAIGSPLEGNAQSTFKSVLKYGQVVGMDKESVKGTLKALTQIANKQKMMA